MTGTSVLRGNVIQQWDLDWYRLNFQLFSTAICASSPEIVWGQILFALKIDANNNIINGIEKCISSLILNFINQNNSMMVDQLD